MGGGRHVITPWQRQSTFGRRSSSIFKKNPACSLSLTHTIIKPLLLRRTTTSTRLFYTPATVLQPDYSAVHYNAPTARHKLRARRADDAPPSHSAFKKVHESSPSKLITCSTSLMYKWGTSNLSPVQYIGNVSWK